MMGNFLTTLGAEPEDDRAMFEELGLNVARQPDNGANPRPDNRSGWLEGETPATPIDELIDHQDEANFWDPSTQLRVIKKAKKPPPYPQAGMTDIADRLEELRDRGLYRRLRLVSGPAGPARAARRAARPAALLEQLPRAGRPPAGARGGRRGGDALGRRRRRLAADLGQHEPAPPPGGAAGRVQGLRVGAAVRLGLPRQHRRDRGAGPPRRGRLLRRAQPRQHHRRLPPLAGRDLRLPPRRHRAPRLGAARGRGPRRADRHRRRLLDGRRRRAAGGAGRAWRGATAAG